MKITIRRYETDYTVEISHDDVTLTEILCLFGGLLRSAGLSFDGEVAIVNPEDPEDPDRITEESE